MSRFGQVSVTIHNRNVVRDAAGTSLTHLKWPVCVARPLSRVLLLFHCPTRRSFRLRMCVSFHARLGESGYVTWFVVSSCPTRESGYVYWLLGLFHARLGESGLRIFVSFHARLGESGYYGCCFFHGRLGESGYVLAVSLFHARLESQATY